MISFGNFVVTIVRHRRISWILISVIYVTAVWSWTTRRITFVPVPERISSAIFTDSTPKFTQNVGRISRKYRYMDREVPTASFSRISLRTSHRDDQEIPYHTSNDTELINSLLQARTTKEVENMLKIFLFSHQSKIETPNLDGCNEIGGIDADVEKKDIPLSHLSLNATAATLRRMAHISVFEARSEASNFHLQKRNANAKTAIASGTHLKLRKKIIADLLEAIGIKLMSHRSFIPPSALQHTPNVEEYPGVFPLCDILQALAVLAPNDTTKEKMRPFAILVVEFLNTHETSDLYKLRPIKLVQCLQAMSKLNIDHPSLYNKIIQRLLKPDAVSAIPARFLAHGLSAIATFQTAKANRTETKTSSDWKEGGQKGMEGNNEVRCDTMRLSRAFMRRLRKSKVAKEASIEDMYRALVATRNLLDLGAMSTMEDEAAMFGFTGLRRILEIRTTIKDGNKTSSLSSSFLFTPAQVTEMISSWASLSDPTREDTVIGELLQICIDDKIIESCSVRQLERIIRSIRKLNVSSHAEVTRCVGEQLLTLVKENESSRFQNIFPNSTSEILRWPVLVHRSNFTVLEPFIQAASILFSNKCFLERSSVQEKANFLWFLSIARLYDEEILMNIGTCLLEDEMVDDCSPKIASRILATFTSLLVLEESHTSESLVELKQDLFYSYSGHLLSYQLSPAETSSALYAYAKANYVRDKGVFDHLVNLLASSRQKCSSRQLSQTIWSCGKMMIWERQEMGLIDDEEAEMKDPPYLENVLKITEELSFRTEELSPTDVAQIMWGIGRLEIKNDELVAAFANRTVDICSSLNSVEISNVLWGIAKVQYKDGKLIGKLSDRLARDDIPISSPRVAASILFSLGRLRWKDEIVFRKLSKHMIDQIEHVNAQSVANTLWAFRAVRMRPPRELLDTWAITRLGIVPAIDEKIAD